MKQEKGNMTMNEAVAAPPRQRNRPAVSVPDRARIADRANGHHERSMGLRSSCPGRSATRRERAYKARAHKGLSKRADYGSAGRTRWTAKGRTRTSVFSDRIDGLLSPYAVPAANAEAN